MCKMESALHVSGNTKKGLNTNIFSHFLVMFKAKTKLKFLG